MNTKHFKWVFTSLVLVAATLMYQKQSELSGYWYFKGGLFNVIEVSTHDSGQLLVELAVPADYEHMNVMAYRQCPYQDDPLWLFQQTTSFTVIYYRSIAQHEVINATYSNLNTALTSLKQSQSAMPKPKYAEIARTLCDNKWNEEREISSLLMLPLSN